jgi:flagellin
MAYPVDGRTLLSSHTIGELSTTRPTRLAPAHALGGLGKSGDRNASSRGYAVLTAFSLGRERDVRDIVRVDTLAQRSGARSGVRSLSSALRNTNRGISMVDVAKEGLTEIRAKLDELLALATEAKDGPIVGEDRTRFIERFEQLKVDIDNISATTRFDGKPLIDGTLEGKPISLNVGTKGSSADIVKLDFEGAGSKALGVQPLDVNTQSGADLAETMLKFILDDFDQSHLGHANSKREILGAIAGQRSAGRSRANEQRFELANVRRKAVSAREFSTRRASAALVVQASIRPALVLQLLA